MLGGAEHACRVRRASAERPQSPHAAAFLTAAATAAAPVAVAGAAAHDACRRRIRRRIRHRSSPDTSSQSRSRRTRRTAIRASAPTEEHDVAVAARRCGRRRPRDHGGAVLRRASRRRRDQTARARSGAAAGRDAARRARAAASSRTEAQQIELRFDSLPSAGVYAEGHSAELCRTPCAFNVDLADGGSTEHRNFVVRSEGYLDKTIEIDLTGAQREFHVTPRSRHDADRAHLGGGEAARQADREEAGFEEAGGG